MTFRVIDNQNFNRAPDGTATLLRELADAVERGEVAEVIVTYNNGLDYVNIWAASKEACAAMAGLQFQASIEKLRE